MPTAEHIEHWPELIRRRYEAYLKTSFFFRDPELRASFQTALRKEGSLLKGPYPEKARGFKTGLNARTLAHEYFSGDSEGLTPALIDRPLYTHQERAIRAMHTEDRNVVVATGTASGKTESFLYPILFELYRQHLSSKLGEPGVRAMILYPMNALANDQRERLGEICAELRVAGSEFSPTFGQYIGQTPESPRDNWRNATLREDERLPGELIFRDEMRRTPPHILLTNFSMLEYLLIRPDDSPLFDGDRGERWQFIVLDEAHQYRGAKGMEMGMLIRRLKQRLREGGRRESFRCIATSATISTAQAEEDKQAVAEFAKQLFGESFSASGVIFGESQVSNAERPPHRYHAFLRALEGAFLVYADGTDAVLLNRKREADEAGLAAEPLEIALCRECGQHYYVGREREGKLGEAIRDPSQSAFGVDYYLPSRDGNEWLCRRCGAIYKVTPTCDCDAAIRVSRCESHREHADQLKQCETCGYRRGGIGDPVQEIVHGSDGPNTVIATALHELLPDDRRKTLAFADSRQEAAFFAWYAQSSYEKLRDRNLIVRAINEGNVDAEGLSIDDLRNRMLRQWERAGLFSAAETTEQKNRRILASILREAFTDEKRLSLSGVGLVKWFVAIPETLQLPLALRQAPWNFDDHDARRLIGYLLDELRPRRAMNLPEGAGTPAWSEVSPWPQQAFGVGSPGRQRNVSQWGAPQSTAVRHFLYRVLADSGLSNDRKQAASMEIMKRIWHELRRHNSEPILSPGKLNGTFRLDPRWLRIGLVAPDELWECKTCAAISAHNIRGICTRNGCPGTLSHAEHDQLEQNHYRILYASADLPPALSAEEHTAQIDSDVARKRQDKFKSGGIHLLSSSTTFEVGVDLGDLEVVFLRNVPPEPFNYTQRVGRAGRRERPGLAITYCRRNPHDLYHYEDPLNRVINGTVNPPRLRISNEKIILRHMVATSLSKFFRKNSERFKSVASFVASWSSPCARTEILAFCGSNAELNRSLREIVPTQLQGGVGLDDGSWLDRIAGPDSRLALIEAEVCDDYVRMENARNELIQRSLAGVAPRGWTSRVRRLERRMKTIADERTLNLLSRKAVIPKYGFPVDVVELEARTADGKPAGVALQRDLSQAIAEYAPGGKVVANKLEWESCGIKAVTGKAWPVRRYEYDDARNFRQWNEDDPSGPSNGRKYLVPEFGFVTPLFKNPSAPHRRVRRFYTTRPFFQGFREDTRLETNSFFEIQVTKALPGKLIILCEGKNRTGFYICRSCGAHMTEPQGRHKSPSDSDCRGTLESFSLGHELVTDVVRLRFPKLCGEWDAYSVAYAVLLGGARTLDVPDTDLNVAITGGENPGESAIVLYDNVPGGAGLVAQLDQEHVFATVLAKALERVQGNCGCDASCYGCLRSYRNQFAHPHLSRERAREILTAIARS